jgi:DNA primase
VKTFKDLDEIKSRLDIVDFVAGYVQLKKTGQNWKGICPFHSEKTASFTVSQSKQIFHCFGCGASGDIIAFASRYENISFQEAVKMLAKRAGVRLETSGSGGIQPERMEKVRHALSEACSYFTAQLKKSEVAAEYVRKRGIGGEAVGLFKIGYAPAGWHNLLKHLRRAGFSDAPIKDAGLAVAGEKGMYDIFRNRIMFPIMGPGGAVIAFGGRAMDDSLPKYINSPETPVFKKSDTLFGLVTAKEELRRGADVLIVEGYMDVIACFQHGFVNAVAPLGTALTEGHVRKLRGLARKAVLVFDGDAAGKAAAKRALRVICQQNYSADVLLLPDGEDPDSLLRGKGAAHFGQLLQGALTPIEFLFSVSGEGNRQTVQEALELIREVQDRLTAEEMLVELSGRTRISESVLRAEFARMKAGKPAIERSAGVGAPAAVCNEEYLLLSAVIAFPERAGYVLAGIDIDEMKDKTVSELFRKLSSAPPGRGLVDMLDEINDDERRLVARLSVSPGFDLDHVEKNIEDCIRRMRERELMDRIRRAEATGDMHLIHSLLKEKKRLCEESLL